ncbi:MAG: DUF192 domain-containing protein [Minisyncoccia bacterium]
MRISKFFFGIIIFGVFIYLFLAIFNGEKGKILCGDRGLISNFNLSGIVSDDFCNTPTTESQTRNILVASSTISVEIASSSEDMMRGLSNRASLEDGKGMLFIFNNTGSHGFWMKDMLIPIDIIFIDENLLVVGIEKSLLPSTYPEIFGGEYVSKYVLEVPAGFSDKNEIKIGDVVGL